MKLNNWFWGLFFLLAALIVIVNQLGYLTGINIVNLVATVFLIAIIIKSATHLNFAGILFPFAFLGILYAKPLGIEDLVPWPILVSALFGSIGLSIIFSNSIKKNWKKCHETSCNSEHFDQVIDTLDGNAVSCHVHFGSSIKYVNTENFQKGFFDCSFGAMKVYFDHATIQNEEAEICLNASFGGIELYLPKNWNIIDQIDTSLAAIEYKNQPSTTDKTVILKGKISFSGITIIYV